MDDQMVLVAEIGFNNKVGEKQLYGINHLLDLIGMSREKFIEIATAHRGMVVVEMDKQRNKELLQVYFGNAKDAKAIIDVFDKEIEKIVPGYKENTYQPFATEDLQKNPMLKDMLDRGISEQLIRDHKRQIIELSLWENFYVNKECLVVVEPGERQYYVKETFGEEGFLLGMMLNN